MTLVASRRRRASLLAFLSSLVLLLAHTIASRAFASPDDEHWSPDFRMGGTDGQVSRMLVFDGRLIVAGGFRVAGNEPARSIAAWDGNHWSPLGQGLRDVNDLVAWDSSLIACGGGDREGVMARGFARWDGAEWRGFGPDGFDSYARHVAVFRGELIAAGSFALPPASPGADSVFTIIASDGVSWRGILPYRDRYSYPDVSAMAVYANDLIVAGSFHLSGSDANHVLRWDGTSWYTLGDSLLGSVSGMTVWNGGVYLSGYLRLHDGDPAHHMLRWDGSNWAYLEREPDSLAPSAIGVAGDRLWVSGYAWTPSHDATLQMWDGSAWEIIAPSPQVASESGPVTAVARYGDELVVAGQFALSGDEPTRFLAAWDGVRWHPLGSSGHGLGGTFARVHALASYRGEVVAAGEFSTAGGVPARNIARWDGARWHTFGEGLEGTVNALLVRGDTLYAGGWFLHSGTTELRHVARWDGASWTALGAGVDGRVEALAVFHDQLYAGGEFLRAGSVPANHVARWDGSEWHALGQGIRSPEGGGGNSLTFLAAGDSLFVGGSFQQAGPLHAEGFAVWDGSAWRPFGPPNSPGQVSAIARHGPDLVITGSGGGTRRWTGDGWIRLGLYGYFSATALSEYRGDLVAAGGPGLLRWDGHDWAAFGDEQGYGSECLLVVGDDLYVGGSFGLVGGSASFSIARWRDVVPDDRAPPELSLDFDPIDGPGGLVGVTLTSSELLRPSSIYATANEADLSLGDFSADGRTWNGIFRFTGTLNFVTVSAEADDFSGNTGRCVGEIAGFTALEVRAGNAMSSDSRLQLRFGGEFNDGYYGTLRVLGPTVSFLARYELGPEHLILQCPLFLDFNYDGLLPPDADPRRLVFVGPDSAMLPTTCDASRHSITAAACAAGGYAIVLADSAASDAVQPDFLVLASARPNPFTDDLHMTFESRSRQRLRVDVFDIRGRRIAALFDRVVGVGAQAVSWNGETSRGVRAPPGVYFVHARGAIARLTRRVVLAR